MYPPWIVVSAWRWLIMLPLWAGYCSGWADTVPVLPRSHSPSLRLPNHVPVVGYGLLNAFPGLTFEQPVALAAPSGETNRLFVVERTGSIYVITNLAQPTKALFLDLSWQLVSGNVESGLLGLTFHPGFATNGFFYVYRTMIATTAGAANRYHDVISRFSVSAEDPNQARTGSEVRLIVHFDDSDTHNAGDLKFGPDGYLYISIGERFNRAIGIPDQTPVDRDLHGSILRIDVDRRPGNPAPNPHPASTTNYAIPADNPFVGVTQHHGLPVDPANVRTELYATGFRNPWRIAFDPFTGELYVADVGEGSQEEVDLVEAGGDYGWPYREGFLVTGFSPPKEFNPVSPLHAYGRGWSGGTNGDCVIGGVVYGGEAIPWLRGRYLFADFRSGYVWSLARSGTGSGGAGSPSVEELLGTTIGLSSFGIDPRDGEVLLTHLFEGTILRLVYTAPEAASDVPVTLADTGIFADLTTLAPNPGVVPYDVNVSFWSDNARKRRWFCLPDETSAISFSATNAWGFPTGAVWIKHFELELTNGLPESTRRLETRVLVNTAQGFYGLTFRWDDGQTNATLVPAEGREERFTVRQPDGSILSEQTWHYPSRAECMNCHTKWGGRVLGFNTSQLNRTVNYDGIDANQLQALAGAGYLNSMPVPEELPALAGATNTNCPLEFRVRSYLQANCSACHSPGGPTLVPWDARLSTPLPDAHILGEVIIPGHPQDSTLYLRLLNRLPLMPPIGATLQYPSGIDLVGRWISSLPPSPWSYLNIGDVVRVGGSTVSNDVYEVGGTGASLAGTNDAFQFLHQPFSDPSAQFIGRLVSADATDPSALAGIMFRDGTDPADRFVMAACWGDGQASFLFRETYGAPAGSLSFEGVTLPQWLRLVRQKDQVAAWRSEDGRTWTSLGAIPWTGSAPHEAGFAVNSGSRTGFNNAVFDNLSTLSITLTSRIPAQIRQPANVTLGASVRRSGRALARVEYYDGDTKIGQTFAEPHVLTLSNLWARIHSLSARAVDEAGAAVASTPVQVDVQPFPTQAGILGEIAPDNEGWWGNFGRQGYVIALQETNLPPYAMLSLAGATNLLWAEGTDDPRALSRSDSSLGDAAAWAAAESFTLSLAIRNGNLQRLRLYFVDWDSDDQRVQRVDFIDPETGRVVTSETLSNFSAGVYLSAFIRGNVDVRVVSLAGPGAVLSGVFLDNDGTALPTVALLSPVDGASIDLPALLLLQAGADDPDNGIQRVQYYLDGRLVGVRTNAPYQLTVSGLREGIHTAVARAYNPLSQYQDSTPATFTARLPVDKAVFLFEDSTTRGNWISQYGAAGWLLPPLTNRWPRGFSEEIVGASLFPTYGSDPDYLQLPDGPGRLLPLLYSYSTIAYNLVLADGRPAQVSLYFHDDLVYPEIVNVFSRSTGKLLDTRTVTNGWGGRYFAWNLQGNVSVVVSNPAPGAVQSRVSGLFLDPFTNAPPQVLLLAPPTNIEVVTPARILLSADASAPDGIREIQFYTQQGMLGQARQPPYDFVWEYPPAGSFQVFARAVSLSGAANDSLPVTVTVDFVSAARAQFIGTDLLTGGNWQSKYGTEGYWLPGSIPGIQLPPCADITADQDWTEYRAQSWPRALQIPNSATRILSFWNGGGWQMRTALTDGRPHRMSVYNYAPGWTNSIRIRLRSTTGPAELLDAREIPNQDTGTYLTWELAGDVTFEITQPDHSTAFVNGLFLDPVSDPYGDWRRRSFAPAGQIDPAMSDETADPDADGYDNWSEFLLGSNPLAAESRGPLWFERDEYGNRLHWLRAKTAAPGSVWLQSSRDLQAWQDEPASAQAEALDRGDQLEQIYPPLPDDGQPWFFRLRFKAPPQ